MGFAGGLEVEAVNSDPRPIGKPAAEWPGRAAVIAAVYLNLCLPPSLSAWPGWSGFVDCLFAADIPAVLQSSLAVLTLVAEQILNIL